MVLPSCAHPPNAVALQNHKTVFTEYIYMPFFVILRIKTITLLNIKRNCSFNVDAAISTKYHLMFVLFSRISLFKVLGEEKIIVSFCRNILSSIPGRRV